MIYVFINMFEFQYFIIGIIQGITEFLPISSSAHLILISELTNWDDQGIFTDIAVHAGTLGAVIIYLLRDIKKIILDFFNKNTNFFALKIIIATLPSLIIGFIFYEYISIYFRNLIVIGWASIIFAIILFFADQRKNSRKNWKELNFFEVFLVGLCQCLAFIPGASRAGVTITGARFLNVKRDSAAIFSMLLSIPIIIASISLAIFDISFDNSIHLDINKIMIATLVAFLTALSSIHIMMKILKKTNFTIFVIYRILLGIIILLVLNV